MDNIDRDILKHMSKREHYFELKDVIHKGLCIKESWSLLSDFGEYFKLNHNIKEIDDDFKMWQRTVRHPNWKPEVALQQAELLDVILSSKFPERQMFMNNIYHLRAISFFATIKDDLECNRIMLADAEARTRKFLLQRPEVHSLSDVTLVDLQHRSKANSLYWRLEDLNRSIGPLCKGDFMVVVKRPEVGGTSFLLSEMGFMLEQSKSGVILFNNEEAKEKIGPRIISSALNIDHRTLAGDPIRYQKDYKAWLGTKHWDLIHDTRMTLLSIRKQLESKPYDLIGINVLLKVGGTGQKEDFDKFQQLGEELRIISQEYAPVIAIVQADPSAEGMQYIPQDRIYKSKTALQGEADGLIMIGTDATLVPSVRYIHVAKNKIPPSHCTDTNKKHIKSEVKFNVETGRFTSKNFSIHSLDTRIGKK